MTIKKLLGQRIKELRIQKNMTQAQLAESVGIDPKHQSCIENGRNFPSADLLDKYSNVLQISSGELLNIEHHENRTILEQKLNKLISESSEKEFKTIYRVITSILR